MESAVPTKALVPGSTVLSVVQLNKTYGGTSVVNNVSFTVGHNEIVGLVGPNGAGKTTIINMVLGVLTPSAGTIHVNDIDVASHRSEALAQSNFAAVYAPLPGNLTVYQNLRIFAMIYGVTPVKERVEAVIAQFDLQRFRNVKCGVLSSGEQTRVSLAKALLNQPRLLLLDEPTASLDPSAARDIRQRIHDLATNGPGGILWASHNMYEVESVCDRVLFLSKGKILLRGNPKTLPHEHGKESLEELFLAVAREPLSFGTGDP